MTATGDHRTYFPNTFQKPNVFVDRLLRLLSGNEVKLLDVATRQIMGWEEKRVARRDRISVSQFRAKTGLSTQTVVAGLKTLEAANILIPVGSPNGAGQMYELNLGQKGDYDFAYLEARQVERAANYPNAELARAARTQKRLSQNSNVTDPSATSGGTGLLAARTPLEGDPSNGSEKIVLAVRTESVEPLETQNSKLKIDSLNPILDANGQEADLPAYAGTLWQTVLARLKLELPAAIFRQWLELARVLSVENGCFRVGVKTPQERDWLTSRMAGTIQRALAEVTGQPAEVIFEVTNGTSPTEHG